MVRLLAASCLLILYPHTTAAQNPPVTVSVDAAANRRAINPNIYGVAHATAAQLNDLNSPLNRNGGNNTTRYNWQLNADNRGNDWYYQSIGDASATVGERGDSFIASARSANAKAMLTIPLVDWVAKVGPGRSSSRALDRQVRPADRQRLAMVSRRRKRSADQRAVRDRQRSERRQRAVQRALSARLDSAFGDTSVAAAVPNPNAVAAFAAHRSGDGALTVMVISKHLSGATQATISLANFPHRESAQVWQLTAANTINRLPDLGFSGSSSGVTLPAQSITLLVVPSSSSAAPTAPTNLRVVRD